MTKATIIYHIKKQSRILADKSLCPEIYPLANAKESVLNRERKRDLLNALHNLDLAMELRRRCDETKGVTFISLLAPVVWTSPKLPYYIRRDGQVCRNVGIGWVAERLATDNDLITYPILI